MSPLSVNSYVVLGLLEEHGEANPYRLDQLVQEGVGHFWAFPRSQLYAEAGRLVRRGLIAERREENGRRRRTLAITPRGRAELRGWLATPTGTVSEVRDEGALRLYFQPLSGDEAEPGHDKDADAAVVRLAEEQIKAHTERLSLYATIAAALRPGSPRRAVLELGLKSQQTLIDFWREVEKPAAP
ncbi:helix-turn-helix transcriptional regulator [Streptomyces sp. NPDC088729]|uniref:helix-turn-helix transcriptional regulator n=1 Tax=Streptomyces sp. NPDC088729 TaxID=3365876 RepID=UPI0037FD7F84